MHVDSGRRWPFVRHHPKRRRQRTGARIFRLSIDSPLQITRQPQSQQAFAGDTVAFSVAIFGSLPVSYQWLKNQTNLSDGANVSGSSSRALALTNISPADVAMYSVVISNAYGAITSAAARLESISSPPASISGPEAQTVLAGSTAAFSVEAAGDAPLFPVARERDQSGRRRQYLGLDHAHPDPGLGYRCQRRHLFGHRQQRAERAVQPRRSADCASRQPTGDQPDPSALVSTPTATPFNPYAGVIQGTDGNFYGTTLNGGVRALRRRFQALSRGALSVLHSFTNGPDGATPFAGLIQASDGNFYGASFARSRRVTRHTLQDDPSRRPHSPLQFWRGR